jgi:hypothetical protein
MSSFLLILHNLRLLHEVGGEELENLIYCDDRQAEVEDGLPFDPVQGGNLEECLLDRSALRPNEMNVELTVKKGIYKIATCSVIDRAMAATRNLFFHTGKRSRLSFSESEFIALNISTVTRMDSDIVVAVFDMSLVNIWHPISGNLLEHWWKWV